MLLLASDLIGHVIKVNHIFSWGIWYIYHTTVYGKKSNLAGHKSRHACICMYRNISCLITRTLMRCKKLMTNIYKVFSEGLRNKNTYHIKNISRGKKSDPNQWKKKESILKAHSKVKYQSFKQQLTMVAKVNARDKTLNPNSVSLHCAMCSFLG